MIILICGFMGAGKTTWLQKLQTIKGDSVVELCDFDDEIKKRFAPEKKTLAEYIADKGWTNFRAKENALLREFGGVAGQKQMVIALGGGVLDDDNLAYIKSIPDLRLVWINTSFDLCWERIQKEGVEKRPLAQKGREYMEALYFTRSNNYREAHVHMGPDALKSMKSMEQFFKVVEEKSRKRG